MAWLLVVGSAAAHEGHGHADGGPNTVLIVIAAVAAAVILSLVVGLLWLWRKGWI